MKRIKTVLIVLVLIFIVGCDNGIIAKTDYLMGDTASIDDLAVELIEASYTENNQLEVVFKITNKRNNTITIVPDTFFRLYDINKVQIPNTYDNDKNIIKKNENITYTLNYKVTEKEIYDIYFYSGIVENNIKFSITGQDIIKKAN